jgi:hypothetical protein
MWSKTSFGPTGHHHPRSSCIPSVPRASDNFKMHPGCRVLWGCSEPPAILPRSPRQCTNGGLAFQFYLQSRKLRKVSWVGDDSHAVFDKIFSGEKRKCETVRCRDAEDSYFVAKVRGEVFAYFHTVAVKYHSSMSNWLFGLPERTFFIAIPSMSKKIMKMVLGIAPHLSRPYRARWVWTFHVRFMLSSPKAYLISHILTPISFIRIHFNIILPQAHMFPKFSFPFKLFNKNFAFLKIYIFGKFHPLWIY